MFGYAAAEMIGQNVKMLMPVALPGRTRSLPGEVSARPGKSTSSASVGKSKARRKDGIDLPGGSGSQRGGTPETVHRPSPRHHPAKGAGARGRGDRVSGAATHRSGPARQREPGTDRPQHAGRRPGRDSAVGSLERVAVGRAAGPGIAAQPARASGRHAWAASRFGRCRGAHGRTVRPGQPYPAGGQGDMRL